MRVDQPLVEEVRDDLLGQTVVVGAGAGDRPRRLGLGPRSAGRRSARSPSATGRAVELVAIPYHLWANRGRR